jgi:two-component system chemotaxis response regulator CheB
MAYTVLVVDDSTFFRRRVREILEQDPQLNVIGDAKDGVEAVRLAAELRPDVITMDVEMPVMDGINAVRKIMASNPIPILMFSSLTHDGAEATLDALEAGALDFIPKKFEDIARNRKEAIDLLQSRVKALGRRKSQVRLSRPASQVSSPGTTRGTKMFMRSNTSLNDAVSTKTSQFASTSGKHYKLLAIGTSTGGPVALQTILTQLPASFPYPILLVQHMPGTFTTAFAERLNSACKIQVKEAAAGDKLMAGHAYLAPGGKQMLIEGSVRDPRIRITESSGMDQITYKPSVDLTFASVARIFSGDVLALILTGMGADGREGCRALKANGAKIWAQDESSCVVYGMPQAVTAANIAEKSIALNDFSANILAEMK